MRIARPSPTLPAVRIFQRTTDVIDGTLFLVRRQIEVALHRRLDVGAIESIRLRRREFSEASAALRDRLDDALRSDQLEDVENLLTEAEAHCS